MDVGSQVKGLNISIPTILWQISRDLQLRVKAIPFNRSGFLSWCLGSTPTVPAWCKLIRLLDAFPDQCHGSIDAVYRPPDVFKPQSSIINLKHNSQSICQVPVTPLRILPNAIYWNQAPNAVPFRLPRNDDDFLPDVISLIKEKRLLTYYKSINEKAWYNAIHSRHPWRLRIIAATGANSKWLHVGWP